MTDLAARLEELSPQKRELLLRQLRARKGPAGEPARPALRRRAGRTADFPLSYAQQRLWFLDRMEPGNAFYNMPGVVRLSGPLAEDALGRAFGEVVRRHEVLRTTFPVVDGRPVQRIGPVRPFPLPVVDLTALAAPARAAAARALTAAEARRPFDLERGPVLRALLLRLGPAERLLAFALHHIASDAWSMRLLLREVTALYTAFSRGRTAPLPALPVQYADYAAAEREGLESAEGALAGQLAYWRRHLSPQPQPLELPADRRRPEVQSFRGALLPLVVPERTAAGIRELARREGATPFMALLAGFLTLLHRYTGREDLAVGTPIANRDRVEVEGLIGFFVNTLVLRADLAGDPPFRTLLAAVRTGTLEAFAHPDLPFEKLVEELQPRRDLSRSPLFQVLFAFQSLPAGTRSAGPASELAVEALPVDAGRSLFDLTLTLEEGAGRIEGSIEYSTDLFDAARIRRMAGHLGALLEGLAARPESRLSELPLLDAAEHHQLAIEWQGPPAAPWELPVHVLFAAQAARTPEAPALLWGEGAWTYRQLEERAGRLARVLGRRLAGAGPEPRVGVCMERSPDLVAALLAVWKAGGAYVPLDPSYPEPRLAAMAEDARIAALVAGPGAPEALVRAAAVVVRPEEADLEPEDAFRGAPGEVVPPEALAYVLYTSGSTGRPKGVAIAQRSVAALLAWAGAEFPAAELAGVLAATSISFDLSVFELFAPLVHGGMVVLAENALALAGLAAAGRVTLVNTVPSALAELVRGGPKPAALRTVNLAGEALRRELVGDLHERWGGVRLLNLYGPSEDTTYSTAARIDREEAAPPIGRPVAGAQAYVVGARATLLPVGVPGELWLGGEGLARGYLGRPDLTAERFVPDPFAAAPGGQLYRTGDLVRLRADGRLDFLGRLDHQLKVRGFRIEPGEVEAVLHRHPAVAAAAVVGRSEEQRLVAFVVPSAERSGQGVLPGELREFVRGRLPEQFVPSGVVLLDALPLTPNGKVDRRSLAAREVAREEPGEASAPHTPAEELLAGIWERLLGVEPVAASDDFFALGGHSLLAARVVSRVREAFGVELPMRALFETPVLATLAARIEAARAEAAGPPPPAIERRFVEGLAGRSRPPLSFGQERLWFLDRLEASGVARAAYNLPSAVRLPEGVAPAILAASLGEVVRRHQALRTVFALEGGEPVQVVRPASPVPLPEADLSGLPDAAAAREARRLAAGEARAPFRLDRDPLLRARLLRLDRERRLLLTIHHVACDGWSQGVLLRELTALYRALAAGRPSPLPEPPIQYSDYAAWQRGWLSGEALAARLAWWRRALAGAPALLDLPTDRLRPPVQGFRGDRRTLELPPALREAVRALGRRRGATPFMTLLAGLQALLHRASGQTVVVVGTPAANRGRRELEELIGFFANTLALASDLSGAPTFDALLGRVRETTLGAYAHQDLPFEKLVQELRPERSLAHAPLFQVLFSFASAAPAAAGAEKALAIPIEADLGAAKFDLTLAVAESEEGFATALEFNTDLFDATTARRLLAQLGTLLAAAVETPETRVSELPLLDPAERHQLLVGWNDTAVREGEGCLHELFAHQAALTPEATAVVHGGERWSFRGLAERASGIARHLRGLGVGPEVPVGIGLERTPEMVAAILGVLGAGGAYVPLDPAYPRERLEFMLADAGASLLLTQERLLAGLAGAGAAETAGSRLRVVRLDRDFPLDDAPGAGWPASGVVPGNVAYLIYTSGSTGKPKGVAIEHRSAAAMVRWAAREFGPAERAGVLASTSICFDLSVFELFLPLCCGGTVVLADTALDLPRAASGEVTLVNTVPSAMAELVLGGLPASVRTVTLAGEALPRSLVQAVLATGTVERVVNLYGPSEDTTYSTLASFRRGEAGGGPPPIGRPVAGGRAYVLDSSLAPAPAGVVGELYLGGVGLARGYLGRPELTAERFVPDPWGEPGGRLYRTGDLARRRADGELLFLGRLDHQVKVRGFRIELGEVEAALRAHPGIAEAVVLARSDGLTALEQEDGRTEPAATDLRLAAYVVTAGDRAPSADELRAFLRAKLPGHMVPWAFVTLAALPLGANGKVDRTALPAPGRATWAGAREVEEPRSEAEREIAAIWREALALDRVGIHDNFFDSGGHSLLAVRVCHRLETAFGRAIPLVALFEHPTVAALARHLERGPAEPASRRLGQERGALRREAAARRRPPRPIIPGTSGSGEEA